MVFLLAGACRHNDSRNDLETAALLLTAQSLQCQAEAASPQAGRFFSTGFESVSDFDAFYLVPQNYQSAASHDLATGLVHGGSKSHHAWIYATGPSCPPWQNCNHRGYPTIQLHKTTQGGFHGIVFVEFYAHLSASIASGQWFSLATFSADASDGWSRVVLVNVGHVHNGSGNYMHLMHVPYADQNGWTYQTSDTNNPTPFPFGQWVKVSICLNMDPVNGSARVWQNDVLVSSSDVRGTCGTMQQAHFGLYAPPSLSSGDIYNDDLTIQEVAVCPK